MKLTLVTVFASTALALGGQYRGIEFPDGARQRGCRAPAHLPFGRTALPCAKAADVNRDRGENPSCSAEPGQESGGICGITIADAALLRACESHEGQEPPTPFRTCGTEPRSTVLQCDSFAPSKGRCTGVRSGRIREGLSRNGGASQGD